MIAIERERGSSSLESPSRMVAPRNQSSAGSVAFGGNEIEVERSEHINVE